MAVLNSKLRAAALSVPGGTVGGDLNTGPWFWRSPGNNIKSTVLGIGLHDRVLGVVEPFHWGLGVSDDELLGSRVNSDRVFWGGSVGEDTGGLVPEPLLGGIVSKLMVEVNLLGSLFVFVLGGGKNEVVGGVLLSLGEMEVHALSWLHSGGNWLVDLRNSSWSSVALNDLELEIDVRAKWDWLSSKRSLSVSISPSLERWA